MGDARGAQSGSLQAEDIFLNDPTLNWKSSEGRALGTAGSARVAAGSWRPTASVDGQQLTLVSLQVESNGVLARFAAGRPDDAGDDVLATYTLPGTGSMTGDQSGVLTVRRLAGLANGVALYEADPVTGAVVDDLGRTVLPGQVGYLQAALSAARREGLVLRPDDMPGFGETAIRTDLPLRLDRNYGALLLVNGSETNMLSSYAEANPGGVNQALSLVSPGRGVSFSFEDLTSSQFSDRDFNDVIITITPAVPTVSPDAGSPVMAASESGPAADPVPAQYGARTSARRVLATPTRPRLTLHIRGIAHPSASALRSPKGSRWL